VFVKICGTTSEDDALLAVALGADALGFVFAPSPRQVAPGIARDIARRVPPEVLTVGVFRDEAPERVVKIVNSSGLRAAQLHGHETPEQVQFVKERVPVVIKALAAGDRALRRANEYPSDAILVDAASPGSGRVFDWSVVSEVPGGLRIILAGGLNAENVGEAISRVQPWGVDVATGVEGEPGHKDPRKLRAFMAAARGAEPPAHLSVDEPPYDWQEEFER